MKYTRKNIRIISQKKELIGSYRFIKKELGNFSYQMKDPNLIYYSIHGILIKFVGVAHPNYFTPYVYTEKNINNLFLRKTHNCFYIPGDSGQHETPAEHYLFKLVEIPSDMHNVNVNAITKVYDIKISNKLQHEY